MIQCQEEQHKFVVVLYIHGIMYTYDFLFDLLIDMQKPFQLKLY